MSEANRAYVHIPTVYRQLIVEAIEDLNSKTLPERDPSETVWSLRKRIKKMRSLLRLMKGNIGKNFTVSDSLARRTAKRAGVLRDRYVLATTAKKLEQSASLEGLPQEQLEALCDKLEKEIPQTTEAEVAIKGATKRLQKLLKLSKPLTKITTEPEQQLERV
ncbi:MAG: CHAD domain-containing protein, partial [Bdellovibrionales bacterium]|nr:CHAD domain-containing protein [Bdellovibrionales bacterium]